MSSSRVDAITRSDGVPRDFGDGRLHRTLYRRTLEANLVGATLAFVYLSFGAPPQPSPPHGERLLYLAVAPAYVLIITIVGCHVGNALTA